MKRLLPALLLLATLPAQAEIYKWVDEKGRTHFGEVVPDKYKKSATPMAAQPLNTIQGSALRGPSRPAPAAEEAPPRQSAEVERPLTEAERCRAEQARYSRSQSCFARYRNANGSLKSEAAENCENVPQPPRCPE